jgi:hypothetical protein
VAHLIAIALTLAWVVANFYLWHVIRSQELLLAASTGMGAIYVVPFWFFITYHDRQRSRR